MKAKHTRSNGIAVTGTTATVKCGNQVYTVNFEAIDALSESIAQATLAMQAMADKAAVDLKPRINARVLAKILAKKRRTKVRR